MIYNLTNNEKNVKLERGENMKYKRFMIFTYEDYYPGGGLGDCLLSEDTLDKAITEYIALDRYDENIEIFDRIEGIEIENAQMAIDAIKENKITGISIRGTAI